MDYQVLAKYIAMNLSRGEIRIRNLHKVVPVRKHCHGPVPGIKSQEAKITLDRTEEESQWIFRSTNPTEAEKRALIGATLEICIAASFNLHIYIFGGVCYRQIGGGPSGSRLTMAVSKVVMLVWGRKIR